MKAIPIKVGYIPSLEATVPGLEKALRKMEKTNDIIAVVPERSTGGLMVVQRPIPKEQLAEMKGKKK